MKKNNEYHMMSSNEITTIINKHIEKVLSSHGIVVTDFIRIGKHEYPNGISINNISQREVSFKNDRILIGTPVEKTSSPANEYYSTLEAARYLGCSRSNVQMLVQGKKLRPSKTPFSGPKGYRYSFSRTDLDHYKNSR